MNFRKKLAASFVSGTFLLGALGPGVALAEDENTRDFSSCVQNNGTGSVMLLMDESGSVYGTKSNPGSDPKNFRITASKIMLDKLQQVSDAHDAPINVMLAGLGDDFKVRSQGGNGWATLQSNNSQTLSSLKAVVDQWAVAPPDRNGRETDLYSSLEGAQKAFANQSQCKLLVLFKDGKDYQYFNKDVTSPVSNEEIQSAMERGDWARATQLAESELCRPGGTADGFRGTGTYVLTVALGASSTDSDFAPIRNFTEGGSGCGDRPGFGKLLLAPSASELPSLFARALDPSFIPADRKDAFSFNMTNALSGISVLTSGELGTFDNYTITPPPTCLSAKTTFKKGGPVEGDFGSGVSWKSNWYSPETFKIVINKEAGANDSCWVGRWQVQPTGTSTGKSSSVIEFDANLQAVAVFEDKDFYLTPDGDPKSFGVSLSKVTPSAPVEVSTLDPSLSLTVSGQLEDQQGKVIRSVFNELSLANLGEAQKLDPTDLSVGTYRLVMTLNAAVSELGVPLRPVRTETTIEVRNKNRVPTVTGVVAFGDIDGGNVIEKEVTFVGSPDATFELQFLDKQSKVVAIQHPEGLSYKFVNSTQGSSFTIPQNSKATKVRIALQVASPDEVTKRGLVSGDLTVNAVPVGSESNAELLKIPFTANQTPDANRALQWLFIAVFTLMGLGITLAALLFVSWLVAKFPKPIDVINQRIRSIQIKGRIENNYFTPDSGDQSPYASDPTKWEDVQVDSSRKKAYVSGQEFLAKGPGLRLGAAGFGVFAQQNVLGWASGASGDSSASGRPLLPLHLQNCWLFAVDVADLPDDATKPIPATLTLIHGEKLDDSGLVLSSFGSAIQSDQANLYAAAQASIPLRLPDLFGKPKAESDASLSKDSNGKPKRLFSKFKTKDKSDSDSDTLDGFGVKKSNDDPFA